MRIQKEIVKSLAYSTSPNVYPKKLRVVELNVPIACSKLINNKRRTNRGKEEVPIHTLPHTPGIEVFRLFPTIIRLVLLTASANDPSKE